MKMRFFERLKDKLQTTEFIYPQRKKKFTAFFCNESHHVNLNLIVLSGFVRLDSVESAELSKSGDVICEVPRFIAGTNTLNQPDSLKGKKTKAKSTKSESKHLNESESKGIISGVSDSSKSLSSTALIRIEASIRRANGEMFSFEVGPPKRLCELKKWLDISESTPNATKSQTPQCDSESKAAVKAKLNTVTENSNPSSSSSTSPPISKRAEKRALREEDKKASPSKKLPRDRRLRESEDTPRGDSEKKNEDNQNLKESQLPSKDTKLKFDCHSANIKTVSVTEFESGTVKRMIHAKLLRKRPPYMGEFDPILQEIQSETPSQNGDPNENCVNDFDPNLPLSAVELIKVSDGTVAEQVGQGDKLNSNSDSDDDSDSEVSESEQEESEVQVNSNSKTVTRLSKHDDAAALNLATTEKKEESVSQSADNVNNLNSESESHAIVLKDSDVAFDLADYADRLVDIEDQLLALEETVNQVQDHSESVSLNLKLSDSRNLSLDQNPLDLIFTFPGPLNNDSEGLSVSQSLMLVLKGPGATSSGSGDSDNINTVTDSVKLNDPNRTNPNARTFYNYSAKTLRKAYKDSDPDTPINANTLRNWREKHLNKKGLYSSSDSSSKWIDESSSESDVTTSSDE